MKSSLKKNGTQQLQPTLLLLISREYLTLWLVLIVISVCLLQPVGFCRFVTVTKYTYEAFQCEKIGGKMVSFPCTMCVTAGLVLALPKSNDFFQTIFLGFLL